MISQGLHISFILLSLILGYQDIQSRTVIAWMYGLTILLGMGYIYTLDIPLSMDHFVSITSFLCVILMITWYKKQPVIAVADILYMILLLYVLESLWTVFFIVLGLSALVWKKVSKENPYQPFIALMLIAYIITMALLHI